MAAAWECFRSAHQIHEPPNQAATPLPVLSAPLDAPGLLRADPQGEVGCREPEHRLQRKRVHTNVEAPRPAEGSALPTVYKRTPAYPAATWLREQRHRRAGRDESPA